ncbi:PPPDE putative peptidase domain-containing protein [Umbelopsis sp. AD052]|nr:PPPDE putative peptidase domain-containing protein [Umbelopsis sp. AD052]
MTSVKLYVYDLSQGMAKQMSLSLTGRQIDGIWHTSVVVFGQEYFYGQGIMNAIPGTTHHGQPMQVVDMGETYLTEEIFIEYLNSISSTFTAAKYHLLDFNCNTFTNDVCQFLTGKNIPDHITDLPADFLNTPFGQSMRPMIENMFGPSSLNGTSAPIQQQPVPSAASMSLLNNVSSAALSASPASVNPVQNIGNLASLENLIKSQRGVLAFFTSSTCPPCRVIEPDFMRKLENVNQDRIKVVGAKIDTHVAFDAAQKYQVRSTPTFMAFVDGKKFAEFSGANFAELNSTVDLMIFTMYPPHCHRKINLRAIFDISTDPILFKTSGNLESIIKKLQSLLDEANITLTPAEQTTLQKAKAFIEKPQENGNNFSPKEWDELVASICSKLPTDKQFPLLDLFRSLILSRDIGNFYTHDCTTIVKLVETAATEDVAKPTLLMTLRLICNTFAHPVLARTHFSSALPDSHRTIATSLLVKSLLSSDASVRQTASSLAFNFSCVTSKDRMERESTNEPPRDDEDWEVEIISAVTNALENETEGEIVYRLVSTLSKLLFLAPKESPLPSLVSILDIQKVIKEKDSIQGKTYGTKISALAREIDELVDASMREMDE